MRGDRRYQTDDFRVEVCDDGIAHIVLGAPGTMPALGEEGHRAIAEVWPELNATESIRAILIRSEGKGFCAGGTPALIEQMMQSDSVRIRVMREARDLIANILACDKPIVSAINGAAVGAGLALALLADISIAGRRARLIDGHTKIGVAAGDHAAIIWPLLCGMAKAKYYLLLSETLEAQEAERIGLVSICVDDDELEVAALQCARRLAAGSQTALQFTKQSLNHWLRAAWPAFEHSLALETIGFSLIDVREGLDALREKRKPKFRQD